MGIHRFVALGGGVTGEFAGLQKGGKPSGHIFGYAASAKSIRNILLGLVGYVHSKFVRHESCQSPVKFFVESGIHLETTTGTAWLIILYLAITCTFLGYLMQNLALTRISERTVALLQSLCPVMTAIFAFFMLGERLTTAGIAGALIIIACVSAGAALE